MRTGSVAARRSTSHTPRACTAARSNRGAVASTGSCQIDRSWTAAWGSPFTSPGRATLVVPGDAIPCHTAVTVPTYTVVAAAGSTTTEYAGSSGPKTAGSGFMAERSPLPTRFAAALS